MRTLKVPYYSQLNNAHDPYGSCNVTSLAMCLAYLQIPHPSYLQFEDYLYQRAVNRGWNRFTPEGLRNLAESFPEVQDDLTREGKLQDIRDAIDQDQPCIVHGFFTEPGHIVVICGYTDQGFIVNDPYGEPRGLQGYNTNASGRLLHFSSGLVAAACDSWCIGEARQRYPMASEEAEKVDSIWLHRLSKKS